MNGLLGIVSATIVNQENDRPISGAIVGLMGVCVGNIVNIDGIFTQAAFIQGGEFRQGILRVYDNGQWKNVDTKKYVNGQWL
jgi:hypothetical protein